MDKATYLKSFQTSLQQIAIAARRGPLTPLPSCPGWTMTTLLGHLATIYISVAKYIRDGTGEDIVNEIADLDLTPEYATWFKGGRVDEQAPPDVVTWFEEAAAQVARAELRRCASFADVSRGAEVARTYSAAHAPSGGGAAGSPRWGGIP